MRTDMLNLYQSRFGSAVKRQGNGWNGPCPLCGGEPGKSDRFMIWPDRAESLGEICATHNITGIWSCRQCGASGDTIAYLMKIDGLDFKAALAELGIEGGRPLHRRRRAPAEPRRVAAAPAWTPRQWPEPSEMWSAYAARLLAEAEESIREQPQALRWLASRGITEEAVRHYRIGYLPAESARYPGRYRARSALGLEPKTGADGKERTKIFIPRGIVIPTFASDGRVLNLRIRRHKEDLTERAPKYLELEGSCKAPLLLRSSRPGPLAAYFVTEAELDAMLIHHVTGGVVGALAVRTNRGKPDAAAHDRLREAVRVCIALDYDGPGADGVEFWEKTYPASLRWPTPEGKDPGDACTLGVDIREWVSAALPPSLSLPDKESAPHEGMVSQHEITTQDVYQNGQLDTSAAGQLKVGGGAEPEITASEKGSGPAGLSPQIHAREQQGATLSTWAWATEDGFTPDELCRLRAALPADMPLDLLPLDVARAYLLWRGAPITFVKFRDENGDSTGFSWERDYTWCRKNSERFEAFWQFQNGSPVLWRWMSDHPALKITSQNLLHIWG
ncbi:primase-helicase zinc-binding domain-containing protein [Desulfovibrio sp. ZJ369]|uniref:primase-helicase zinc-binding domain-containing protein n=1 Tax=Desulfovibrio sp. ZJ369 TaxID=2709793 RepID=UPI001F14BCE6|nr:primase-helicase zinc-binding domain-containing protein [Desulfovibrio sp. ZJ369]